MRTAISIAEAAVTTVWLSYIFLSHTQTVPDMMLIYQEAHFPHHGLYCPSTVAIFHAPRHHCYLGCIQSSTCAAVNYNTTEGTCGWITTPCVQAYQDDDMAITLFRVRKDRQCLEWRLVGKKHVIATDDRVVYSDDLVLVVSRIMVGPGYFPASWSYQCFTSNGSVILKSRRLSLPCEILLLHHRCTSAWVPYIALNPIPPTAVMGGLTADGSKSYVVMFESTDYPGEPRIGYYVEERGYGIISHRNDHHRATEMKILTLL